MISLFWISAILIVYIYVGYPLLLKLLPKRPLRYAEVEDWPSITILIPAFNEAAVIEETLRNKLEQNYPADKLDIIVISDDSEDGTDEIVGRIAEEDPRVQLLRQSPRQGKTAGLNKAVKLAKGELLVFSDANSEYAEGALKALVTPFSDPEVGYVTGKMVYVNEDGNLVGDGCSTYMRYENVLRTLESQVSSVVGVDGGIDAMRRRLYQPMSADQLPDFVQPLKVVSQRYRVSYCDTALLHEGSLSDSPSEYRMRIRVSLRAYWAMWDMKRLFNPFKYGLFSIQMVSHKLLRYLAFIPLVVALVTSSLLVSGSNWFYLLTTLIQWAFYAAAAYSFLSGKNDNRWMGLAHYFCLINIASMMAFVQFLKRKKIVTWKPRGA